MTMRVCSREGCGQQFEVLPHHPKMKYCSTFCRQKAKRERYAATLVDRACPTCGKVYQITDLQRRNNQSQYCSKECRPPVAVPDRYGEVKCVLCGVTFTGVNGRSMYCKECNAKRNRESAMRHYYAVRWVRPEPRMCAHCGKQYQPVSGKQRIYCGPKCAKRAKKNKQRYEARRGQQARRRIRQRKPRGAAVVYRARIFERDGWKCQLCGKKVDKSLVWPHPMSATLDHIVPLANGGAHVPENCQLAHFICNSTKSNGNGGQLRLFAY